MRSLSEDLRRRVVAARQEGLSATEVSQRLRVGRSTVYRILQRFEEHGDFGIKRRGGYVKPLLGPLEQRLRSWIETEPGLTLEQLCERLQAETGLEVGQTTMWRQLRRMGLKYKKNAPRSGAGST